MKKKEVEKKIEAAYKRHGNGVQIPMLVIPRIYKAGQDAAALGLDIDAAVKAAIENYRLN